MTVIVKLRIVPKAVSIFFICLNITDKLAWDDVFLDLERFQIKIYLIFYPAYIQIYQRNHLH